MLAGHDPASVRFPLVVGLTWAVLIEIYREYGMKFDEAIKELNSQLADRTTPKGRQAKAKAPTPVEEAASMAMLQSMMGGSDFGGPRG